MLQIKKPHDDGLSTEFRDEDSARFVSPAESLSAAVAFVGRQYPVIVFVGAIVLVLGLVYIFSSPSRYTAQASLIIDTRKVQLFQQAVLGDPGIDAAAVESQVEILKSENIALAVIKNLRLTEDTEFVGSGGGFIVSIFRTIAGLFKTGLRSNA